MGVGEWLLVVFGGALLILVSLGVARAVFRGLVRVVRYGLGR